MEIVCVAKNDFCDTTGSRHVLSEYCGQRDSVPSQPTIVGLIQVWFTTNMYQPGVRNINLYACTQFSAVALNSVESPSRSAHPQSPLLPSGIAPGSSGDSGPDPGNTSTLSQQPSGK